MAARNEAQLKAMLTAPMLKAMEYTIQKAYEIVITRNEKIVYGAYNPKIYHRANELLSNWKKQLSGANGKVKGMIEGRETNARSDITGQIVKDLYSIIYQGLAGEIYGTGPWTEERDAWQAIIDFITEDKVASWFATGLRKAGLKVRKN